MRHSWPCRRRFSDSVPICSTVLSLKPSIPTHSRSPDQLALETVEGVTAGTVHVAADRRNRVGLGRLGLRAGRSVSAT